MRKGSSLLISLLLLTAVLLLGALAKPAEAEPLLQLYLEGATY